MRRKADGFTLVELTLAMAFLSMLLLAIALMIVQVTNMYTKGITLVSIDRTGQAVSRELETALSQALPDKVEYVSLGTNGANGARLCTGTFSYVWNYGPAIAGEGAEFVDVNKYIDGSKDIRFVKVQDADGAICKSSGPSGLPQIDKSKARELIGSADRDIALNSFSIYTTNIASSAQSIYTMKMGLGTNNAGESDVINGQLQCKPPQDGYNEFCAVNTFLFTARAGNQDVDASGGNG